MRLAPVGFVVLVILGVFACAPVASPSQDRALPTVELMGAVDEPSDLADAISSADVMLVGRVVEEIGGARYYGGATEEDPGGGEGIPYYEDVTLRVDVLRVLQGSVVGDTIDVQWLVYANEDRSESGRRSVVHELGVAPPNVDGTYVFVLKDFGEPYGLRGVSPSFGHAAVSGPDFVVQSGESAPGWMVEVDRAVDRVAHEAG